MTRLISLISNTLLTLVLMGCCSVITDPPVGKQEIEVGPNAHALIQRFEGFSSVAYPDAITGGAPWTYGYGFTTRANGSPVQPGDTIPRKEADARLAKEAQKYCGHVLKRVPKKYATQNRIDAAASLCWNIGVPNLQRSVFLKKWIAGDINGAAKAMHSWVCSGTPVEKVLRARRRVESALFQGESPHFDG
jgi:lysozyme